LHNQKRTLSVAIILLTVLFTTGAFNLFSKKDTAYEPLVSMPCQDASYFLDIPVDTLFPESYVIKRRESVKNVLNDNGLSSEKIEQVRKSARQVININYTASGMTMHLYKSSEGALRYAVLEKNPTSFVVFDIFDKESITYNYNKQPVYTDRDIAGVLNGDLYTTFKELDIPRNLIYQIEKVYDYTFNLYKLRNGDTIRVRYEEMLVDGQVKKATQLKACVLTNRGERYYAIGFKEAGDKGMDFYDNKGNALKRSFLEKPLKYGRISSKFNKNRVHPVLKVKKAHLGTDFAAPHGTPIIATADGVIEEIGFKKYNGNYVKIKHDKVYSTQYLHMSRFAAGKRKGTRVKQGEIIGYVGSTGLATGPHVCYRFWKSGQQVDPFRENLRFARQLDGRSRQDFLKHYQSIDKALHTIEPWNTRSLLKEAVAAAR
jgi:murein DD-endopeptidase MepM/ murein hydrolase activator NlpD